MRKFELRLQINCIAQLTLRLELSSSARNFKLISAQQILPAAINAGSYRYYHHHANRHLRKSPHNRRFNSMSQSAERCSRFHHQVRRRKNFFFDCVDEPQIGPRATVASTQNNFFLSVPTACVSLIVYSACSCCHLWPFDTFKARGCMEKDSCARSCRLSSMETLAFRFSASR